MTSKQECNSHRLKYFSNSFFALVLGLAGFALALQKSEEILHLEIHTSQYVIFASIIIFLIVSATYIIRIIKYPEELRKEFHHPIKINFFPLISKIFLIYSIIFLVINISISKYLWIIGTAAQFVFTIIILSTWIQKSSFETNHVNPAWFIPIVGSVIVPITGVALGFSEVSWFFFSIGITWWALLFVIVMNRIIFHHPLPEKLLPTMFILFAPPAIACISLSKLLGEVSVFGKILYYISLFTFILVITQAKRFAQIKFYMSWWAYSFPTAAILIASLLMYHSTKMDFFRILSGIFLAFIVFIIAYLIFRTIRAMNKRSICIYED